LIFAFIFLDFKDAGKQKQNLLSSPNQIDLNKMTIANEIDLLVGETKINGHKDNSPEESDEDTPVISTGNGHGNNETELSVDEQAATIAGETNKQTNSNEPDTKNGRKLFLKFI
jgi:hypothetical protein